LWHPAALHDTDHPPAGAPRRLAALPSDVQSTIYHKAGRHTREVGPHWRDTYGALSCGVQLEGITTKDDIENVLAFNPHRFHHTTALRLRTTRLPGAPFSPDFPAGVIRALPPAFPKLQSLQVSSLYLGIVAADDLQSLTPLRSCLTSLALPEVAPILTAIAGMTCLTALRSLSFHWHPPLEGFDAAEGMRLLSYLPHLQQLHYPSHPSSSSCPAATLLPALRTMDLTDLGLNLYLHGWDLAAIDALRTALPRLSALTLIMDFEGSFHDPGPDPVSNHAVMAALAQRRALRSLSLDVQYLSEAGHHLGSLSALRLAELRVQAGGDDAQKVEALLEAMAVQRTLTNLSINKERMDTVELSEAALRSLAALVPRMQRFALSVVVEHQAALFDVLGSMLQLTVLELFGHQAAGGGDEPTPAAGDEGEGDRAACQLARLTALEELNVAFDASQLMRPVLQALPALTNLRQLGIGCNNEDDPPAALDPYMWNVTYVQRSLTHLALSMHHLSGPTLAGILCRMTALQQLELSCMPVLMDPQLLQYLLPLPPTLRVLGVNLGALPPEVQAGLQAAALLQRGGLSVGF
jgi:hypothetical protein